MLITSHTLLILFVKWRVITEVYIASLCNRNVGVNYELNKEIGDKIIKRNNYMINFGSRPNRLFRKKRTILVKLGFSDVGLTGCSI